MKKSQKMTLILVQIYFIASLLSKIIVYINPYVANCFYIVGSSSGLSSLIGFGGSQFSFFINLIGFVWAYALPILLIIAYILSFFKKYGLFCILVILDNIVVIIWCIYAYETQYIYNFDPQLLDVIISTIYTILLICSTLAQRQRIRKDSGKVAESLREP